MYLFGEYEKIIKYLVKITIIIKPKIIVKSKEDIEVAENLIKISKKSCFISNSLKSKVILEPEVKLVS